jgi:hypothetical protein
MKPGSHIYVHESVEECEGMNFTLPNELPFWELESQWIPKFSENNRKGQNPLDWNIPEIIKNILERICLKWIAWPIWVF